MARHQRRFSAHIGNLFTELPIERRVAAAARAGFAAIEFPDPYAIPAADMARALADNGLSYVQLGVIGDTAQGDKGLAAIAGREAEFHERLQIALDYAAAVGAQYIHVLAGILSPDADRVSAWSIYVDNLALAVEAAAARGQAIMIEAMSPRGAPGYFLDHPNLALGVIRHIGHRNLGLMVDVFHSANAGVDPAGLVRDAGSSLMHVHLADHPGRHEPGTGAVDFAALLLALDDVRYGRFLGCEYIPKATTAAGLDWLRDPVWRQNDSVRHSVLDSTASALDTLAYARKG
jgi:hydroxypyruvate isomerase